MCTSIAFNKGEFCFGRNMDIEYSFGERVVFTPRRYPFYFRRAGELKDHYAILGMAAVQEGYPLYADAMNEHGLCMAGLSFPESVYPEKVIAKEDTEIREVSPFEFIPWVLGKCGNIGDVRALLKETAVVNIPFSDKLPLTPLHWHIADRSGSFVVECIDGGMNIYDDPVGVLTNSPDFTFHYRNLQQYYGLSVKYPDKTKWGELELSPFGRGFGGIGLPGDYSPASRFVKAAFLANNSPSESDEQKRIAHFFHDLDSVSMPKGIVFTQDGKEEITLYSCCMSPQSGTYYYKTYYNSRLSAVKMQREDMDGDSLKEFPLDHTANIQWLN